MRMKRQGFSLVELLASLAVSGLLAAVTLRLVDRTQRFASGTAALADQRGQLAGAAFALRTSLETASSADSGMLSVSDSSVAYSAAVGHAVACVVSTGSVDVPPYALASGVALTWWNTSPQPGDAVALYDDGPTPGAGDDQWLHAKVTAVSLLPNACQTTPFVDSIADAGKAGWRLWTSVPIPASVIRGAPVRVTRPERFALYRSAGEWMLGWTEWNVPAAGWNVIQPLAGPLLPYGPAGSPSGARFVWRDSLGAPATIASGAPPVYTAGLSLAAPTRRLVRMDGVVFGVHPDSLGVMVLLRNAK